MFSYEQIYWLVVSCLLGLCVGSFLNVVILRAFSGESIVLPPSKCPKCGNKLKWYHNIPILSYLFLRGKCGFCKEKISVQYPLVEAFTGIMFSLIFYKFGFTFNTLFLWIFTSLFIVIAVTDIKENVIFDFHAYILAVFGLIYNFFNISKINTDTFSFWKITLNWSFIDALLGLILGVVIIEGIVFIFKLFTKKRGFGEGDSYVAAALGACFGWKYIIVLTVLAFIMQAVLMLPWYIFNLIKNKRFKTFFNLVLFAILLFLFKFFENILVENIYLTYGALLILVVQVYFLIRFIFNDVEEGKSLPLIAFAPALIVAAFIVIFYGQKIITYFPF